jgi:hypothetical protein
MMNHFSWCEAIESLYLCAKEKKRKEKKRKCNVASFTYALLEAKKI